jgi:hypothetical protein
MYVLYSVHTRNLQARKLEGLQVSTVVETRRVITVFVDSTVHCMR